MNPKPRPENLLNMLPKKWAIAIIVLAIVYALSQPWLNRQFGWKLPSLTGQPANPEVVASNKGAPKKKTDTEEASQQSKLNNESSSDAKAKDESLDLTRDSEGETSLKDSSSQETGAKETGAKESGSKETSTTRTAPPEKDPTPKSDQPPKSAPQKTGTQKTATQKTDTEKKPDADSNKKYGLLEEVGRNRFRSPAGLIYAPGSEEGHRLAHIERHLEDQENRPGSHGVFDGDMASVLRWIDDAYVRSQKKSKGTTSRDEDGRTVIEANFDKPIGYVGGRDGKRKRNPPAKRLRLVVDDKNVITAFPF